MPTLLNTDFFGNESLWSDLFNDRFFNSGMENKLPSVNVIENTNEFMIEVAAPGLKKEDFKINIDRNILTLSFEHKEGEATQGEKWLRTEYKTRSFKRSFTLNEKVDPTKISARYADGILYVTLTKKEQQDISVQEINVQ